ncbi:MAG: hypothetical protein ABEK75_00210 [Salinibacter sp.]
MLRSFLQYTRIVLLPLLAVGLVLTGCDSTGSNGGNDGGGDGTSLTTQTARNLLTADIKSQTDGLAKDEASEVSEDELLTRYNGDTDGVPILIADRVGSPAQNAYSGTTLESAVSTDALTGSAALEQGVDSPNSGPVTADELIRFYLGEVASKSSGDDLGSFDVYTTANQVDMSQLVNKLLLGALEYKEGASALNSITGTTDSDQDRLVTAAEHFGAPDDFEAFLDYANGDEGLAGGALGRDVNDDGQVDFNTEFVHTWAGYAAERSALAENNGNPNDFARTFKSAIDEIRTAIENDDSSVDVAAKASTALEAWEKVVAVNVIHYVNSMKSDLEEAGLGLDEEVTVETLSNAGVRGDYNEHWGEGKPFAWALQFNAQRNPNVDLQTLHEDLGAAPPYTSTREGTVTRQDVIDAVEAVKNQLETAYGFNSSNVDAW